MAENEKDLCGTRDDYRENTIKMTALRYLRNMFKLKYWTNKQRETLFLNQLEVGQNQTTIASSFPGDESLYLKGF